MTKPKCFDVGSQFGRIKSEYQDIAESVFNGRRKSALSQLKNVLSDVRKTKRVSPSMALDKLISETAKFRDKLSSTPILKPLPKRLLKQLEPIYGLAMRAAKEAKKKYCG
jgi:hypothetical protein